jgi:1-phosphatidylinositol-4-phosphate 5-kinase
VKRVENFFKGLTHERAQISPIPPEGYGDRFVNFINKITMSKEEAQRSREAHSDGHANPVESTHASAISTSQQPDTGTPGPSILPIVDEAGEGSSVGGHSQRSPQCPSPRLDKELPLPPNHALPKLPEKQNRNFQNGQNLSISV